MRILFLFLILLNLGYFMWQWPQQTNDKILPNGPLPVIPNSKTLTLLSELPNSSAAKPPARGNAANETQPEGNP